MIKSTTTTQELRLQRPNTDGPAITPTTATMDTLKTSFLPNLSMGTMEGSVITTTHFCPMCGQQFERPQHAAEHMQLCHGISGVVAGVTSGGGILLATPQPVVQTTQAATAQDTLKIDYPCLSCDDKFPTPQELDEHNRLVHQSTTFLARCLACGIFGISSVTLQEGDEYKCMHCGSVCTASALTTAQQPTYVTQQSTPPSPDDMPSIPPQEMNSNHHNQQHQQQQLQHHHQQQQQQVMQQQQVLHLQQQTHHQHVQQHQQQQQPQQQQQQQQQHDDVQLKVPPLTVKLNKNGNGNNDGHPQVIIKQEPLTGDPSDTPTCVPVYTIQQAPNATSVVVSTASVATNTNAATSTTAGNNTAVRANSNKARHKCPDCPKTFKTPGTLAMHRKVHTGEADVTPKERPYTCSYCGKSFTQSNTLKQHTRIHTGEKPYHCDYCEKSFSVKDYLTKHTRTHTGEKPYICPYCDKRFTQRSALTVHTTKLHPL